MVGGHPGGPAFHSLRSRVWNHPVEVECWFVFSEAKGADKAVLQGHVLVVWQAVDEIQQSSSSLLVEGCDNIVILHFVG